MTAIETFCKVYTENDKTPSCVGNSNGGSSQNNNLKATINNNKIEFSSNEGKCFEFNKVFNTNQKDNTDIFPICCDGLTHAFINGYNTTLLLLGSVDCLKTILFESDGLLSYLVGHVTQSTGKELKNQKEISSLFYMNSNNMPIETSSFLSSRVKHEVTLKLYQVDEEQITDLLRKGQTSSSSSSANHHQIVANDITDEFSTSNVFEHSILGTSSKRTIKLLNTAFQQSTKFSSLEDIDHTCLIIEFCLSKFIDGCSQPICCRFRTIVIPIDSTKGNPGNVNKPLNILKDVVEDYLTDHCPSSKSSKQTPLERLLCELVGGHCYVNTLTCVNQSISPIMMELLELSSSLKQITNYPVPTIPQVKLLIKNHREKIQELETSSKKGRNKESVACSEMRGTLESLSLDYERLQNEKCRLETYVKDVEEKYSVLVNLHAETSSNSISTAAEKLLMTKEMVDLKLQGNYFQQGAEKSFRELKKKLLLEEEKSTKLNRDFQFECKMHEELKSKHKRLQVFNEDLNGEYVNMKLNYQHLKNNVIEKDKVITELKKTASQLVHTNSEMTLNNHNLQAKQGKKFKEDLQKLASLLSDIPNRKDFEWEHRNKLQQDAIEENKGTKNETEDILVEHKNELLLLEDKLFSVRKQLNEKEEAIVGLKHKLSEVTTHFVLTVEEKKILRGRLLAVERTFQNLSQQYQDRLETYIKNVNEYVSRNQNNGGELHESNNLQGDILKMVNDLREAHKDELLEIGEKISLLSARNESLFEKCTKLMVAYRLLLGNRGGTFEEEVGKISSLMLELPDDAYVKDFQFQKIRDLESKLKAAEEDIKTLQEKITTSTPLHPENSNNRPSNIGPDFEHLWMEIKKQIRSNSKIFQESLEKEKAELLTRCTVAEKSLECYKEMMEQQALSHEYENNCVCNKVVLDEGRRECCDDNRYMQQQPRTRDGNRHDRDIQQRPRGDDSRHHRQQFREDGTYVQQLSPSKHVGHHRTMTYPYPILRYRQYKPQQ